MNAPLRVVGLYAKNILRLREVEVKPDGTVVIISGKNEQGKSSLLNCLYLAFKAASAKKVLTKVIREGEERAQIILDIGEYVIVRRFKMTDDGEVTTSLNVEQADGTPVRRPQSFLDGLLSNVSFDPAEFEGMKDRDRRQALVDVFGLNVDSFDEKIDELKKEKRDIGTELKMIEGQLGGLAAPTESDPTEEKSASDLVATITKLREAATQRQLDEAKLGDLVVKIDRLSAELDAATREHAKLNEALKQSGPAAVGLDEAEKELQQLEVTNARAREVQRYHELYARATALREEEKAKKDAIELVQIERSEEIETADIPVDGLEITADGVLFDGVPFAQMSQAARIKISMSVAMAANPRLRVIRISNGSLLDKDNMALIKKMAEDNDYQVWVEVVDGSGDIGVYVEDGEVAAVNQ